jgi:putative ABC transport system permease protein
LWELVDDDAGIPRRSRLTAANYYDWEAEARAFERMALFGSAGMNWTGGGEPEELLGARVSASYFEVLGIAPVLGHTFVSEEMEPGRHRVVLLSHGLWQRRFGGSKDVLGKKLTLDGEPFEVIGVMPEAVYPTWPQATGRLPFLPLYQQIWVPMALSEERRQNRDSHVFGAIARLRSGETIDSARVEMDTIARRLAAAFPENQGVGVIVVPYLEEVTGSARPALLVLWGSVALVLLIACANIASLLLARSASREREVALRTALGASRARVLRQFLGESTLLAVVGGALGVGLAFLGVKALVGLSPAAVPRLADSGLSVPVLLFALAVSILTGLVFGLAPAIQMTRSDRELRLKARPHSSGVETSSRRFRDRPRDGAGHRRVTSRQSFVRLRLLDLGFQAANVLVSRSTSPVTISGRSLHRPFPRSTPRRLRAVPECERADSCTITPRLQLDRLHRRERRRPRNPSAPRSAS